MISIRPARAEDDAELVRIDDATWRSCVSPAPRPPPDRGFFDDGNRPADVLVAEVGATVAGYVSIGPGFAVSHAHVLELTGLAVDPAFVNRGVGRRLVEAAVTEARERGARKLTLRVLASNTGARRLYDTCGFEVEGVLREEFRLDGGYVDDVLMARQLR